MGMIISTIMCVGALFVIGVFSAMAASKADSDHCEKTKKINVWMSVAAFLIALVAMMIAIFLL